MRRAVIIANRGAGSFSGSIMDNACRSLAEAGIEVELLPCNDFGEMTATAARISSPADAPLVIAAGGDGTINAVFNGLAGNSADCAILPMGTANVLARELGLETVEKAVARIVLGESRPLTAGLVSNGSRSSRFFLMAGIGFDGRIVRGVTPGMKKRFGKGAYLLSAMEQLRSWETGRLRVSSGETWFECHSVIICNASLYGGSFTLAPDASLFSPTLEVVAVRSSSRSGQLKLALETLKGGKGDADGLIRLTAERIRVEGAKPLQADGDDWGDSPVEIVAEREYAELLV